MALLFSQQGTEHIRAITTCVLCLEYLKEKGTTEMIGTVQSVKNASQPS